MNRIIHERVLGSREWGLVLTFLIKCGTMEG